MRRCSLVLSLCALLLGGCCFGGRATPPDTRPFVEARRTFHTRLERRARAPRVADPSGPGIQRVRYRASTFEHDAWLARERSAALLRDGRAPLVVYLHSGNGVEDADFEAARPFLEAGFAVLAPAFRGENGNIGEQEMYLGELDDAHAVLERARTLDGIDPDRIVVFGHSSGGILSALLAMFPDLHVLATGSAGGLYDVSLFDTVPVPFHDTPEERRMRVPVPHLTELAQSHWACIGEGDSILAGARDAVARARASGAPIELVVVPGDHLTSAGACVEGFVAHVLPRLAALPEPTPPATPLPIRGQVVGVGSGPFDLVATDSGAAWVWSAFGEARVRVRRLDALGRPVDPDPIEIGVYDGAVREVARS
jgi:acetyl esterase/lipase